MSSADVWAVQSTKNGKPSRKLLALNTPSPTTREAAANPTGGVYRDNTGMSDLVMARKPSGKSLPSLKKEKSSEHHRRGRDLERQNDAQRSPSMSPSSRPPDPPSPTLIGSRLQQYPQDDASARSDNRRTSEATPTAKASLLRNINSNTTNHSAAAAAAAAAALRTPSPVSTVGKLPPIDAHRHNAAGEDAKRPSARTPPAKPLSSVAAVPPPDVPLSTRHNNAPPHHAQFVPEVSSPLPTVDDDDGGYLTAPDDGPGNGGQTSRKHRIRVAVRKRPLNAMEGGEDCVLIEDKVVHVEARKLRVDLTEYVESHHYVFDDSFSSEDSNEEVYTRAAKGLVDGVFEGGSASCFAYGQTGSGKTHTMMGNDTEPGLYFLAAQDIFARLGPTHRVFVSLYEIYCNSLFDLLNHRAVVVTREDANKRVNVCGLTWHEVTSVKELLRVMERGAVQRRTGSTSANEFSSRSHAVMTITLRDESAPKFLGMLNVVDLAGSERAADTAANDKQTRLEGAEINKSLLALKECIRGLDERKKHIPFRGSKLTEVLRDSFVGNSRTVMIATISPSTTNAEHSLNTLRYAFRVKGLSIDCPQPCAERNAPRPTVRSKSQSSVTGTGGKDKVDKEKKKKKKSGDVRRRRKATEMDEETLLVFEAQMKAEMEKIRVDMENLRLAKQQDEATIRDLQTQNEELVRKMENMRRSYTYHDVTGDALSDEEDDRDADTEQIGGGGGSQQTVTKEKKHRHHRKRRSSAVQDEEPVRIEELGS